MTTLESLIEPLRHSPQLVEALELLNRQIAEEIVEQNGLRDGVYAVRAKAATGTLTSGIVEGFTIPVRVTFDEAETLATLRGWM